MSLVLTLACALALQAGAGAPVAPPAPFGPVPSERQLAWHERQFYGFVHFGPNTFTGVEWGEGREDPRTFAPSDLDCRQWVAAMKSAGMTGVILTAKHHDGFCLFASEHTTHDVESSGAPRDVLKELADACRAQGLWLGVYLSPWDRREPLYGTGEPYNEHFRAQLREALTNYGEVAEVWFDGACGEGPNGKRQVYDWPSFVKVVRDLQPGACIFRTAVRTCVGAGTSARSAARRTGRSCAATRSIRAIPSTRSSALDTKTARTGCPTSATRRSARVGSGRQASMTK
ncbi:MAG: alpha-L-fucosidase [Planctomycetota bacterium]